MSTLRRIEASSTAVSVAIRLGALVLKFHFCPEACQIHWPFLFKFVGNGPGVEYYIIVIFPEDFIGIFCQEIRIKRLVLWH